MAPNGPLYSIGQISLLYLAEMTEKQPNVIPQINLPAQIVGILSTMQIEIPMSMIIFMMCMSLTFPIFLMKGSQPIAPTIAPRIYTPVTIELYLVCSSGVHLN